MAVAAGAVVLAGLVLLAIWPDDSDDTEKSASLSTTAEAEVGETAVPAESATATAISTAPEELSGQGLIAYRGADEALRIMNSDGSDKRILRDGPIRSGPVWSPNGRMLAYTTGPEDFSKPRDLRVVDLQGHLLLDVSGNFAFAIWSPDSQKLAVQGFAAPRPGVTVLGIDGTVLHEVTSARQPSFSLDGGLLAFRAIADVPPDFPPEFGAYLDIATGEITRLEPGEDGGGAFGPPLWRPRYVAQLAYRYTLSDLITPARIELPGTVVLWSPDGSMAVVATNPEGHSPLDLSYGLYDFALDDFGADRDVVSFELHPLVETSGDVEQFASELVVFSSTGRYLAWTQDAEFVDEPTDAYVYDTETGQKTRVPSSSSTFTGLAGFSPDERFLLSASETTISVTEIASGELYKLADGSRATWQPGGALPSLAGRRALAEEGLILFIEPFPDSSLWVMNADGSEPRMLHESVGHAVWSPNGKQIAIVVGVGQGSNLRVLDLDGNRLLDYAGVAPAEPVWSPDGEMIAIAGATSEDLGGSVVVDRGGELVLELPPSYQFSWSEDSNRLAFIRLYRELSGLREAGVAAWVEIADGEVHLLDDVDSTDIYSGNAPGWRPGAGAVLGYGDRLIDLATGTEDSLPGEIIDWSCDGRLALLRVEDTVGDFIVPFDLYNLRAELVVRHFEFDYDDLETPNWLAGQSSFFFSPGCGYMAYQPDSRGAGRTKSYQLISLETGDVTELEVEGRLIDASPDDRFLLLLGPGYETSALIVIDLDTGERAQIGAGAFAAWQPAVDDNEDEAEDPALAVIERDVEASFEPLNEFGPIFAGDCDQVDSTEYFGACSRFLGTSGDLRAYNVLSVPGSCPFGVYFIRFEAGEYTIDHVEPPFCNCEIPCQLKPGSVVEIEVEETCANARAMPAIEAEINVCLDNGARKTVLSEPVTADARVWVETDVGWIAANFIACVENCG